MSQPPPNQHQPQQWHQPQPQQWQQPYPPQPVYYVPVPMPAPQPVKRGDAIASLVCGIIALFIPFAHLAVVFIVAIVAVIEGAVGIQRRQGGMAVAGLVLGIIGLLFAIVYSAYLE